MLDWVRNLMGGGVIKWEARPDLLPDGMAGFQKKLGLPLVAHNRWYDKETEYKKQFKFVDGVGDRNPAFRVVQVRPQSLLTHMPFPEAKT